MRKRGLLVGAAVLVGAAAIRGRQARLPGPDATAAARRGAVEMVRSGAAGRGAALAGISASAAIQVIPLAPGELGGEPRTLELHRFLHRCAGCHSAPSPRIHTQAEWRPVVTRMEANMRAAGILPLPASDRVAILRFLDRHAKR